MSASPTLFLLRLITVLFVILTLWEIFATPHMKAVASRMGDAWTETGKKADRLNSTSWRWNWGLTNDPKQKWSDRP